MIHIRSEAGDLIRILPLTQEETVHYHETFGFATRSSLETRTWMRTNHGLPVRNVNPLFSFNVKRSGGKVQLSEVTGIKASENSDSTWSLESAQSKFKLHLVDAKTSATVPYIKTEEIESKLWTR